MVTSQVTNKVNKVCNVVNPTEKSGKTVKITTTTYAGKIKRHVDFWKSLTNDRNILKMVKACDIEFDAQPSQAKPPLPYKYSQDKKRKIDLELLSMLDKKVIEETNSDDVLFLSNIFTKDKSDGSLRVILDLTELNEFVTYRHFKMDSLQTAINLMSPNCYMASIDLKDAYYSVPIDYAFRNYLAFQWRGKTYRYTCLPNGLACAPRLFTKLTKVLYSNMRRKGFISISYIDDCLLIGKTLQSCKDNVDLTVRMTTDAGFTIHPVKSIFTPTKEITYLGFLLNSQSMTVRLTPDKALKLKQACQNLLNLESFTIRLFAGVVGLMVASIPGVQFGKLFYRCCDNLKTKSLKQNKGDFNAKMTLSPLAKSDIAWWIKNIDHQKRLISQKPPGLTLETDASNTGWGACIKGTQQTTGGFWSPHEAQTHINYRELLAVWLSIQCFGKGKKETHIKILSDNTTTVAYLNNQGGTKSLCNKIARKILMWCYDNNNWISAAHLPGKTNTTADKASRSIHDNMEWKLNPDIFKQICEIYDKPTIDLFASRLNFQIKPYMSWKPDPEAYAIDALSENWKDFYFYAFPPFNLIGKVLHKIELEGSTGILVVPEWHTQTWWPKFKQMCINEPLVLYRKNHVLSHHRRHESELPRMKLLAGLVSSRDSNNTD